MRRERVCVPDLCSAPQGGDTPLHIAVLKSLVAVVEMLLAAGAATNTTNKVRVGVG